MSLWLRLSKSVAGRVIFFVLISMGLLYWIVPGDPNDPQGDATYFCDKMPLDSVTNGQGLVATAHTTACTTLGTDVATYIYVHKVDEADSSRALVFRFSSNDEPRMNWINDRTLHIAVRDVDSFDKQIFRLDGVDITYTIKMSPFAAPQNEGPFR
jgi:hypothetical protein